MKRYSFVHEQSGSQTLRDLPPSTAEDIRRMALAAGLNLPESIMQELCVSYPAFEAMVRRLPRARDRFDEPAHHIASSDRVGALDCSTNQEGNS
jgi:hypothetical protein